MLFRLLTFFLLFMPQVYVFAADCDAVFPSVGTQGGSTLSLPTFLTSSSSVDYTGSSITLAAGEYDEVVADASGTVTFTETDGEYRMSMLYIGDNASLNMVAGDYYVTTFIMADSSELVVNGSGTVRIYADHVSFEDNTDINLADGELIVMGYDDIIGGNQVEYKGLLYAADDITIGTSFDIYGAAAAIGTLDYGTPEIASYDQETDVDALEFDGVCTNTEGDLSPLAYYTFEDASFSSEILDSSGEGNDGDNDGGEILVDGKYCQGFDTNGTNSSDLTDNAFNTRLNVDNEVGDEGSISFWFNSNTLWSDSSRRTLFDASSSSTDKYFYLEIQSGGKLNFKLEDSNDDDFGVSEESTPERNTDQWYHISVNWDLPRGVMEIFVDGTLVASETGFSSNGELGNMTNLRLGDNSSTYLVASPNSANGNFDEVRVYDQVRSRTEVNEDRIDSSCAVTELKLTFDEGTGQSTADISGNDREGTLGSSTSSDSNDPTWTCSGEGFHLDFDASNDERVTTDAFTPPSVGAVSFWLKTSAIPSATEYLFGFDDGWEARWESDGFIYFDINKSGTNSSIRTSTAITDTDTWIHFVLVTDTDNNTWELYINGSLDNSWTEAISAQSSSILTIGGSTGQSNYFNGSIDDFRIYSGELTTDKITALAATAPTECIEELAYFSFEQTDFSTEITDFSGNDNHGSNQGGVVTTSGKYCSAFDSDGDNNLSSSGNAFNSGIDVDAEIGLEGTVSFWFNSDLSWGDSSEARNLFDAGTGDKYFYLQIRGSGKLAFKFENSDDTDFTVEESSVVARSADTWYYVTVTWNFTDDIFIIYVDGEIAVEKSESVDGSTYDTDKNFPSLGDLYFGDNAPSNVGDIDRSIDGQLDEVRIYAEVLSQARIQAAMNDSTCLGGINHYQIEHDYYGITCDTESVVVRACSNEFDGSCTQSSAETTVTLNAIGASDTQTDTITFTGSGSASFDYTYEEDVTLSLTSLSITPSEDTVCNDDGSDSCVIEFTSAGFRFLYDDGGGETTDIPNQIAGDPFNLQIEAVVDSGGACVSFLRDTKTLQIAQENVNPGGVTGLTFEINDKDGTAVELDKYPTITSDVILEFTSGKAPLANAVYHDAGRVRLYAQFSSGSVSIEGSSSAFWVVPYELQMAAKTSAGGTDINNNLATGTPTHKAGETFYLEVQAVNATGDVTQNYEPVETQLLLTRTGPDSGGVEGVLNYASGTELTTALSGSSVWTDAPSFVSSFSNGISTDSSVYYNEVGLIALDIQDIDYGGEGIVVNGDDTENDANTDGELNIGRFTPDHFELTFGAVSNAIAANESTYMGQPSLGFQFNIVPKNAIRITEGDSTSSGETLSNYIGDFVKSETLSFSAENNNDGAALDSRLDASDFTGSWADSVYSNTDEDSGFDLGTFARDSGTTVDGPFDNILYGINFTDDDGITLSSLNENADKDLRSDTTGSCTNSGNSSTDCTTKLLTASESKMRYARWKVENAYGPETADLPIPMRIEYWNGTAFVVDEDNSITTYNSTGSDVTVTNIDLPSGAPTVSGNGTFTAGKSEKGKHLMLGRPGSGNRGKAKFNYHVGDWFKFDWNDDGDYDDDEDEPSATATFGLYRGNDRIIYWRELNN